MSLLWPNVYSAVLTALPSLSGWSGVTLFDGPPVGGSAPQQWAALGIASIDPEDDNNGTLHLELSPIGNHFAVETGDVPLLIVVGSGTVADYATNRATAFTLANAVRAWFLNDPTFGVLPVGSSSALDVTVASKQNRAGTAYALVLIFTYETPVSP